MNWKLFLLAFVLIGSMVGFVVFSSIKIGPPPVRVFEGVITAKEWVPAHDDTTFIMVPSGSSFIQVPVYSYTPDEWRIYIGRRWAAIPKSVFDKIEIGQRYSNAPKATP